MLGLNGPLVRLGLSSGVESILFCRLLAGDSAEDDALCQCTAAQSAGPVNAAADFAGSEQVGNGPAV